MVPEEFNTRRILLVTNDLGPRAGGIETFLLGLLGQLRGSEIVIYTSSQSGDKNFDRDLETRFDLVVIRDKAKILLPTPRVTKEVKKIMSKYGSEIIWFGAAAPLAWMAPKLKRAGAKKIIALSHGHEVWWSRTIPFSFAMRRIGNNVDVITYLAAFTRDAMRKAVGNRVKLVQIAPGISVDHFKPGEKPLDLIERYEIHNRPTIVCVGRLVHRKGQDKLIKALREVRKEIPEVSLLLIGEGPYLSHLKKLTRSLGLEKNVKFLGRLKYDELPQHILLGDVFAMPSRSRFFGLEVEGLGIVYLEAGACGIPVIAGNSGGAPDAVLEGKTGFVVNGTDESEIAKKLLLVLSDKQLASELGAAGRQWAIATWQWEIWGKKFAELLTLN